MRGRELFFDATRVRANADVDFVAPRLGRVVGDHIEALFPEGGDASDEPPRRRAGEARCPRRPSCRSPAAASVPPPAPGAPAGGDSCRALRGGTCWTGAASTRPAPGRRLPAPLGRAGQPHRPGRHAHAHGGRRAGRAGLPDPLRRRRGRARIILHALTTPGDVRESQPMLDLLWRVRFRWRVRPKCAVGDSKYGTVENIMALEDEGIRAYFPLADTEHRKGPYYPLAAFAYDAERDEYRCPQGQPLRRAGSPGRRSSSGTSLTPRSATPARSRPRARPGRPAATCTARSTRRTSTGCGPTTRRRPTRRRCASGRSGSSRSSARPNSGTACASSASAAC